MRIRRGSKKTAAEEKRTGGMRLILDNRPGLNLRRLAGLMSSAIHRCKLELGGAVVLTEAATGAYVVTPVLAALAGASRVYAVARSTCYGDVSEVEADAACLAEYLGVRNRITVIVSKSREVLSRADIITNSGHVRPIDAEIIRSLKRTAVISLMYEPWELRSGDVDLAACREKGILVAGINERHPAIDAFSFLGLMGVKLLVDAGIGVWDARVLVVCDNPFGPFLADGLGKAGASVDMVGRLAAAPTGKTYDAILFALQPRPEPVLGADDASLIAECWPGAVAAQFWGDFDRTALVAADVPFWPRESPSLGHMGILLSAIGPEPIVRLQAGGLKVGELLWRARLNNATPRAALAALRWSDMAALLPLPIGANE